MRPLALAVLLALSLVLASCGGGNSKSGDEAEIRQAVSTYTKAIYGKSPTKLCDVLITRKIAAASKSDRDQELARCRKTIKARDFAGAPKPGKVDVSDVKVDGDKATARVATGAGKQRQSTKVSFRRVDGSWRILAGT